MLNINLNQSISKLCNGQSRRDCVRVGTLGPLGLTMAHLLQQQSLVAEESPQRRAKSVILVYLGGGLSHHDSFDLKPEAPAEIRGKYKPVSTCVPGIQICELLPKISGIMDRVALIRSGSHTNDHHETATNWALSGRFGSAFGDFPSIGAVVANQLGFTGQIPPYVAIPHNPSFTWELGKSAFLGGRYESFKAGDPNQVGYRVRDLVRTTALTDKSIERRRTLLQAVDSLARQVEGNDQIATYDEFQKRASEMILSPQARTAFDIEQEPADLRDSYGRNMFGQSCLLARRLVESGVTFTTINYGGWDHHGKIFESLDKKLPEFDMGFSSLIRDLDQRGLLNDTLVACFGEFGRSPGVNKDAGRDHWGPAASMLFAGAGIQPGQVIGATDDHGGYAIKRPVRPADLFRVRYPAASPNLYT